ncbi:ribosome assembly cofactor RimP [Candidatus Ornithobacterium hominis]|uniref:ribosome assembly cofactor RimP n=1 Tax=Candidatus Ornithobacterium hominis TaxID=2497989 RepID=UPI0024BCA848|nr:ribosome assembly cofactor RimP [Candidatus Ornithobacterium hominis]CAI9428716.1 ribosome assembly cofactor RimP [Candidatus Ornithobacterium hominis]
MKEKVEQLIQEALEENPSLFLVDWEINTENHIEVLVDGDEGLPIDEVVRISRHIEHNLDRDEADFSLTVSSPGATRPLEIPRQFKKNIGRKLKVKTDGKEFKGELIEADEESITLQWKQREKKPLGKGKHTVTKVEKIAYEAVNKATVELEI